MKNSSLYTNLPTTCLTNEETLRYLDSFNFGDESALLILILYNLRLAISIAKRYFTSIIDNDDLISNGVLGLIIAIKTFNKNKNPIFNIYASITIRNTILAFIKSEYPEIMKTISYEELITNETSNNEKTSYSMDFLYTEKDHVEYEYLKREKYSELINALNNTPLKSNEKKAIMLKCGFYGKVYNQEEIGEILEVSQRQASTYINDGYRKIKKYLDTLYKKDGTTYTKSICY